MTKENAETQNLQLIEDRIATQKDLLILELRLMNEIEKVRTELTLEIHKMKSYLMTRLGALIVGSVTFLGVLGYFQ